MNKLPLDEALFQVAAQTLEGLAMMFLVPPEEAPADSGQGETAVHVRYTGPFSGELRLKVSSAVLPVLATNMLGLEEGTPPSPEQQNDALKELANVICGNLLPVAGGSSPVFHISAPAFADLNRSMETSEHGELAGRTRVFTDVGRIELAVFADQPTAVLPV
jgi:hypothetical protein